MFRYCEAIANVIKLQVKGNNPFYHTSLLMQLKELSDKTNFDAMQNVSWIQRKMVKPSLDNLWNSMEGRLTKFIAGDGSDDQSKEIVNSSTSINESNKSGPFAHFSTISPSSTSGRLSRGSSAVDLVSFGNSYNNKLDMRRSSSPSNIGLNVPSQQGPPRAMSATGYKQVSQLEITNQNIIAETSHSLPNESSIEKMTRNSPLSSEDVTPTAGNVHYQPIPPPTATLQNIQTMQPPPPPPQPLYQPLSNVDETKVDEEVNNEPEEMDDNEGGNFVSLMDTMGAPTPMFNIPEGTHHSNKIIEEDEFDDDLGFGNDSTFKAKQVREEEKQNAEEGPRSSSDYKPPPPPPAPSSSASTFTSIPPPPPPPSSNVSEGTPKSSGGWFSRSSTPMNTPKEDYNEGKRPELKQSASSSWLSRWWKKDGGESQSGGGPIKAKLGEQSSFYYDPEQKRWVNKNADANTQAPKPPPPPPRASTTSPSSSIRPPMSSSVPPPANRTATGPPITRNEKQATSGLKNSVDLTSNSTDKTTSTTTTTPPPPMNSNTMPKRTGKKPMRSKYVAVDI